MSRPCLRRSTPRRIAASAAASSPPAARASDDVPSTTPHAAATPTASASASDDECGRARNAFTVLDLAIDVHDRTGRRVGDQVALDRLAADRQLRGSTFAAVGDGDAVLGPAAPSGDGELRDVLADARIHQETTEL